MEIKFASKRVRFYCSSTLLILLFNVFCFFSLQKYDAITKQEIFKANLKKHVSYFFFLSPSHWCFSFPPHNLSFFSYFLFFSLSLQEKQKRIRAEVKAVWAEVDRIKEIATMKAEVRAARDNKATA